MGRFTTLWCLVMLATAGAAWAESAFDLVFRSGTLDRLPAGSELSYDGEGISGTRPGDQWGRVVVALGSDDQARVEARQAEGPAQPIGSFRAAIGNPVAMVFLERTVRSVAEATGGSPTYIRNRIREALGAEVAGEAVSVAWDGGTVAATAVALVPFAEDEQRDRLGAFADLEVRFVVSDAVPGWYVAMSAEAPATATDAAFAASLSLAEPD